RGKATSRAHTSTKPAAMRPVVTYRPTRCDWAASWAWASGRLGAMLSVRLSRPGGVSAGLVEQLAHHLVDQAAVSLALGARRQQAHDGAQLLGAGGAGLGDGLAGQRFDLFAGQLARQIAFD